MSEPTDPWAAVQSLGALIERHGLRWALVGGLAANMYRSSVRATGDADLLVSVDGSQLPKLIPALAGEGWRSTDDRSTWMLRVAHPQKGVADVMSAGMQYQRDALRRATAHIVRGFAVPVLAVEDVIVHKLIADRAKDTDDVESILRAGVELDHDYLGYWLDEWEVRHRYDRCARIVEERRLAEQRELALRERERSASQDGTKACPAPAS